MKILTVAIPCYNSEQYMSKAIESVLVAGEDVEIIVVNDGSKDNTESIAKQYEAKYPSIVRAVSQENGGHGEAVNTGLKNATGMYYKVLDSDDWFDEDAFLKIIEKLKQFVKEQQQVDVLIGNYVYEKVALHKQKVMDYKTAFPVDQIFTWNDVKHFTQSQVLLMHSVFYRTELLRETRTQLPKHTFYVDNIFVYHPLPYVKKMYYMDVDVYRYYIGREDQSVNEKIMIGRIDQQIKVTKAILDDYPVEQVENKNLRKYMVKHMSMMMAIPTSLLLKDGTKQSLEKKEQLWKYFREEHPQAHTMVRKTLLGWSVGMRSRLGCHIVRIGYQVVQKFFGFN